MRWEALEPLLRDSLDSAKGFVSVTQMSPELVRRLKERFNAGALNHQDNWMEWPSERFVEERAQERDDLIIYTAMWSAARAARKSNQRQAGG